MDIIFPLEDGNSLLDSNAAWGQIAFHTAEPITMKRLIVLCQIT